MPNPTLGGIHTLNQLYGQTGSVIVADGIGNTNIFAYDNGDFFWLVGYGNSSTFVSCRSDTISLHGANNTVDMAQPFSDLVFMYGSGNSAILSARPGYQETGNTVVAQGGFNDSVLFSSGCIGALAGSDTFIDNGFGTTVTLGPNVHLTVLDFANDAWGKINLSQLGVTPAQAVAMEQPDGYGGTMIAFGPDTSIDFAHTGPVSAGHFG